MTALDLIASRLELQAPDPATARRARGARTVSREFVLAMLAAVEALPQLQALGTFDTRRARDVLESQDALRLVSDRVTMLLTRLNYTVEARWSLVAADAMAMYSMATSLARDSTDPELIAHLKNARRHLARTSTKRKKKKDEE